MTTATIHIYEDTGALLSGHGTTQTDVDGTTIKFGLTDAVDASGSPIAILALILNLVALLLALGVIHP